MQSKRERELEKLAALVLRTLPADRDEALAVIEYAKAKTLTKAPAASNRS